MSKMVYGVCTMGWEGWRKCVRSWDDTASTYYPWIVAADKPIPVGFNQIYYSTTEPIIAYIHDDLVIHERDWDLRVLKEFEDPSVGLVGFAGALGHGNPKMYEEEFKIPNLVRRHFRSNLRDAERHGGRCSGAIDVSVLDGMALFVRRSVLDTWGGWPVDKPVGYFMYSENLCCEVRRQGLRIRLVGVDCEHLGGKSSGTPLPHTYDEEHLYFYEHNRDVMPAWVTR
jgi:GT2 family glycosyltransferase